MYINQLINCRDYRFGAESLAEPQCTHLGIRIICILEAGGRGGVLVLYRGFIRRRYRAGTYVREGGGGRLTGEVHTDSLGHAVLPV